MKKLTVRNGVRITAQVISLAGAAWGFVFLYVAAIAMLAFDWIGIFICLFSFVFGSCLVLIAYLMIWRYSIRSVKWFSLMAAFLFHGWTSQFFRPYQNTYLEKRMMLEHSVSMFAPVLLAVLFYFACKVFIVKGAELEETS